MYAETFNVRPWLEEPAKWLRWAMQSLTSRNLDDVRYNLKQFWNTLASAKGSAKTQQDWSEVLTLDSQSQWTLGNLYQNDASDVVKEINGTIQVIANSDAIPLLKAKLAGLNKSAQAAFDAQVQLATQAAAAAQSAGVQSQAQNSVTVGNKAKAGAASEAAWVTKQADTASQSVMDDLLKTLQTSFLGVPVWAWAAGGVALLLLLTTTPGMAARSALRAAEGE